MDLTAPINPVSRAEAQGLSALDFDGVVRENQQRIFRLFMALLRDRDAADTLTQETFLKAYRYRESFRGQSSVATWLNRIAVNLANDHRRDKRTGFWRRLFERRQPAEEYDAMAQAPSHAASAERQLIGKEAAADVWSIVESLPHQQKAIFTLRFAQEMSVDEIAETMELKAGTVKTHLFRALARVREETSKRGGKK